MEVGCGVGAQTVTLARRSPGARFTSIDLSADSVVEARRRADPTAPPPTPRGVFCYTFFKAVGEKARRSVRLLAGDDEAYFSTGDTWVAGGPFHP